MSDDDELIDALRDALRADTSSAQVPDRVADRARRTALRRTGRRAFATGVPLVAAAVALVLVTHANPRRTLNRGGAPQLTTPQGHIHDTAFIVRTVSADVAGDRRHGIVIDGTEYSRGHVSPSGATAGLGDRISSGYRFVAPRGAVYWRSDFYDRLGATVFAESDTWTPTGDGAFIWTRLLINTARHTYSKHVYRAKAPVRPEPGANIEQSPSQLRRALQDGRVRQQGTTFIRGVRAITLSVELPATSRLRGETLTLYVDAQTYQPLRTVLDAGEHFGLEVDEWLPASAHNIAMATDDSIPAGYKRVARAY